ncbi:MAG TPA: pitrilysin family protein, partial [Gemmatimonadaceae bacterium]|nr:pitrilysin family protein [Gemmatimonadaceae bacterium]
NGLDLVVVEHHELPVADFILVVGSGVEADPAAKSGLATLTATMLDEGTATRNALQIADQVAFLGAELDARSGWDASQVVLHTPTAQLDSALALFADVVRNPSFAPRELERIRQERLTTLLQIKDRGPDIANRAYPAILFGAEHPYGRPAIGTETSTRATTRADLQRFFRSYYRPNNATLIVVGDVTPDDIERRVTKLFGDWQRGDIPSTPLREPTKPSATTIYVIDKPGAPQSSFRLATIGVPRSTEDYFAIQVMNTILGASFTSRLNNNLRETKGYTYGAGSGFAMRRAAGPFIAQAEIVAAKTDSALLEFLKELKGIRDTVSSVELARAKQYLQLQLPGDFETTRDIAAQLVPVVLYGLPLDYYNTYVQQIDRITQADVQRVAQKYIDPNAMLVVIVGDRASIEPALEALNVGDVQIRDLEGKPVRGRG